MGARFKERHCINHQLLTTQNVLPNNYIFYIVVKLFFSFISSRSNSPSSLEKHSLTDDEQNSETSAVNLISPSEMR